MVFENYLKVWYDLHAVYLDLLKIRAFALLNSVAECNYMSACHKYS